MQPLSPSRPQVRPPPHTPWGSWRRIPPLTRPSGDTHWSPYAASLLPGPRSPHTPWGSWRRAPRLRRHTSWCEREPDSLGRDAGRPAVMTPGLEETPLLGPACLGKAQGTAARVLGLRLSDQGLGPRWLCRQQGSGRGASLRGLPSWTRAQPISPLPGLASASSLLYIHSRPRPSLPASFPSLQKLGEPQREKNDLVPGSSERRPHAVQASGLR